ncbi:MBL fold metallo-hydrolase [Propionicimonas sp.]|uniref:MBL fold metallo-hydrolase n=1 Tax=Propionicimonas sp. TaxID=1955623 RepID=UPI0018097C34|nr:MBL fold metallo-hydrolase [Propionicimonas sp.]MBU3977388.1 MBL fold metallo-hydrolase [Actinomycetota bacterium]MBA3021312.1 MBL fold metallo-hydrolase [Propionicimonas sp.]MBU3985898.1 MBL fold metallo-hydrolase [Actinomycetota bacterium]MBU4008683.1 MBL fold metallo-hydrolase [Actinomycetota bacterium]MBU4066167.1 MBL fold metallo-hydrolase [Actinomycetota bacterium]
MFLASFATGYWQANCYVVALPGVDQCVIVDPGQDSAAGVRSVIAENRFEPRAILLTHGHYDHVADAAQLADDYNVAVYIHPADRHLLSNPTAGLSSDGAAVVRKVIGENMALPARVEPYPLDRLLNLARLDFAVSHAPGHTAGSVLISLGFSGHRSIRSLVFTGDVVFAGSVGRTDLPGGNAEVMRRTLSEVVLGLPDTAALLPGHGEQTTMAVERAENPYLQPSFLRN